MCKRILTLFSGLILCLCIVACGNGKEVSKVKENTKEQNQQMKVKENNEDKINDSLNNKSNEEIKEKATKAEFVNISGYTNKLKGKEIYLRGKVTSIDNKEADPPEFVVITEELQGFGVYSVINFNKVEVKKGDEIKVYGKITGDKKGMPQLSGNIIEKD